MTIASGNHPFDHLADYIDEIPWGDFDHDDDVLEALRLILREMSLASHFRSGGAPLNQGKLTAETSRRRLMQLAIVLQQALLDWECEELSGLSTSPAWDAAGDGPEPPFGHPGPDFDDSPPGAARELADALLEQELDF